MTETKEERTYNVLIYGIEKKALKAPREPVSTRNFCLYFEPFSTQRRFHEFDGVVLFQGIFEHFEWKRSVSMKMRHFHKIFSVPPRHSSMTVC